MQRIHVRTQHAECLLVVVADLGLRHGRIAAAARRRPLVDQLSDLVLDELVGPLLE
jgi:hypothetical protein